MAHAHIAQIGRSFDQSFIGRLLDWSVGRDDMNWLPVCSRINFKIDTLPRCSASVLKIVLTSILSVVRLLRTSKSNSAISFHRALNFTLKLFNLCEFF